MGKGEAKAPRNEIDDENEDEDKMESAPVRTKKRRPSTTWADFHKLYAATDLDTTENLFAARMRNTTYEFYPEKIQQALREKDKTVQEGGASQQIEYDMTDGWLFKIWLITAKEKPE